MVSKLKDILNITNCLEQDEVEKILSNLNSWSWDSSGDSLDVLIKLNKPLDLALTKKIISSFSTIKNVNFKLEYSDHIDKFDIFPFIMHYMHLNDINFIINVFGPEKLFYQDNILTIVYFDSEDFKIWAENIDRLRSFLVNKCGFNIYNIELNQDLEFLKQREASLLKSKLENDKLIKEHFSQKNIPDKKNNNTFNTWSKPKNLNSTLSGKTYKIADLIKDDGQVNICAKVFSIGKIKTKTDKFIYKILVWDGDNALTLKGFDNIEDKRFANIKLDTWFKFNIKLDNDTSDHNCLIGIINAYEKIIDPELEFDDSENKRIELCLHTKMSAFDGVIDIENACKYISNLGMKGFGLTDINNVQIYPEAYKSSQKYNLNIAYGVEIEVLDDITPAILNATDKFLDDVEYVVFDIESTGLYAYFDDVIEFGAVRIKNNQILDKTDFFIKPTKPIPEHIKKITHIDDSCFNDAYDQYEGLLKIKEYISDAVLVAHNGINFDFNFLNTKFEQYNIPKITNPCIDSLPIARFLLENTKSHTLNSISDKWGIEYNTEEAHRADYDADVLAKVWIKILNLLKEQDILNLNEINNNIQTKWLKTKSFGSNFLIYVKNQDGMKALYELISIAHTKTFFKRPCILMSDLMRLRKDLIISNAVLNSDILNASLSNSDSNFYPLFDKYDYITIGHPNCFDHEIGSNNITESDFQIALSRIITTAKKINKKVCVSSNPFYLKQEHKRFRDVYINTPGLGGKPHRFNKFNSCPDQCFLTTNELIKKMSFLNDDNLIHEIVVKNPNDIFDSINKDICPLAKKLYTPYIEDVDKKMTELVYKNATSIFGPKLPDIVQKRIDKELNSIIGHGYAVVYWISHLLVKKSLDDGYVVGSRGSVGSSLVATLMNITDVNPLPPYYLCNKCYKFELNEDVEDGFDLEDINCECGGIMQGNGHNIPFEVFLGFHGDKVPDIDLNFSGLYQPKAHAFIKEMFGDDHAFRAGTISTVAKKTAYGYVKSYFEKKEQNESNATIEYYANGCLDVKRTTGQHPGGIVVVPNDKTIFEFTPYNYPADDETQDWFTTHFAFEYIHDNLLKFDILGHDNPTALSMLERLTGIDQKDIPNYDKKVMSIFSDCKELKITPADIDNETTGAISLPEYGTQFVRKMLEITKPNSFADLIRISGLSHGTDVWSQNAELLIKNGHTLKTVIGCRDDIMVYLLSKDVPPDISFKVMEDCRKGKGIKAEYLEVLKQKNIESWWIESANKIKYMFPKAHATAYVIHAWKFAWYKLYYPLEYYATWLTIRTNCFDIANLLKDKDFIANKLKEFNKLNNKHQLTQKEKDLIPIYEVILEMISRGYSLKTIDLNKSLANEFLVDKENNAIICPFSAIDGIGEAAANSVVEERNKSLFKSIEDIKKRTKLNKQNIDKLKNLGVLDQFVSSNQMNIFDF